VPSGKLVIFKGDPENIDVPPVAAVYHSIVAPGLVVVAAKLTGPAPQRVAGVVESILFVNVMVTGVVVDCPATEAQDVMTQR
jgi:hypothetical protein